MAYIQNGIVIDVQIIKKSSHIVLLSIVDLVVSFALDVFILYEMDL